MSINSPAPETDSGQRPSGSRSRRALLGGSVAAVVLVVIFGLLFAYLRTPRLTPLTAVQAPQSWRTYRDPAGFFTIRIPPNWQTNVSTGEDTMGNNSGSFSTQDEQVSLSTSPALLLGTGVSITVEPLPNAFARQWDARAASVPQIQRLMVCPPPISAPGRGSLTRAPLTTRSAPAFPAAARHIPRRRCPPGSRCPRPYLRRR